MPNFDDMKPMPAPRFVGAVDYQVPSGKPLNATQVVSGCAILAQNMRFSEDEAATRYGSATTMEHGDAGVPTGIDVLEVIGQVNPGQIPIVFDDHAHLFQESPSGSGKLIVLASPIPLPASARMLTSQTDNRLFAAFSDGAKGLTPPLVIDGRTGNVQPISQNVIGALWLKGAYYLLGDLVRSVDGRWWRCTVSCTGPASAAGPAWKLTNGQFVAGVWTPSQATDVGGGTSQWEEWTPNCANALPAPDVSTANVVDNPGGGTIAAGKDVYIKLSYVIPQTGESPRSAAAVFSGTGALDAVSLQFSNTGGGPFMPRWMAEINLQSNLFYPFFVNIWIAVVAHGDPVPVDSAYGAYALEQPVGSAIIVTSATTAGPSGQGVTSVTVTSGGTYDEDATVQFSGGGGTGAAGNAVMGFNSNKFGGSFFVKSVVITNTGQGYTSPPAVTFLGSGAAAHGTAVLGAVNIPGGSFYPQGAAIALTSPNPPVAFQGQNGTRYMMVDRQDTQGSLVPVDPNSPIAVSLQGQIIVNILSITRTAGGAVQATVVDITGFATGQQINLASCTGEVTFNGSFVLNAVSGTQAPEGILSWQDDAHLSAANDSTGTVELPPGPTPVAFLPPGGTGDLLDIAGFSVAGSGAAGPFFYIGEADPTPPVSTTIVSLQGSAALTGSISTIDRVDGGQVQIGIPDVNGFAPGMSVKVEGASGDPSFNEEVVLTSVEVKPAGGTAGILGYTSTATGASSDTTGSVTAIVAPGSVIAVLESAVELAAGQVVAIQGTDNPAFNGQLGTIASILGNVAILSLQVVGTAGGGVMTVQQNLPTSSAAGAQAITSITRDAAGNVLAQVPNLGGWAAGHIVKATGVGDTSFNGVFELVSAALNPDGLSGVLGWAGSGVAATSSGGTVQSFSDIVVNFDDTFLTSNSDLEVTNQLSSAGAPTAVDLRWIPSFGMMAYTTGQDNSFRFSQIGDPANISGPSGALVISDKVMSLAIAVRELESGEVIALKTNGGFSVNVSDLPPAQWNAPRRWDKHGPPCAAAIGEGYDFLAFPSSGEESGAYLYKSGSALEWISKEYSTTWKRVNWSASSTFWTEVDDQAMEVHFGVALDDATEVSHELVCNYEAGWEFPEVLNRYGKLITPRSCRKWSIWPIASKTAKVVKRTLTAPAAGLIKVKALPSDSRYNTRQFLRGVNQITPYNGYAITTIRRTAGVVTATIVSAGIVGSVTPLLVTGVGDKTMNGQFTATSTTNLGGGKWSVTWNQALPNSASAGGTLSTTIVLLRVTMAQADRYNDDGLGIDSQYLPAFSQDTQSTSIIRFGGFRGQCDGAGKLVITPTTDDPTQIFLPLVVKLLSGRSTRYERGILVDNECMALLYSNNSEPDAWFAVQQQILYGNPYQAGRRTA